MASSEQEIPIKTLHLFPVLDGLLIELLQSLTPHEWHAPTIAKLWSVKDIASHLLDGNLRTVSILRDHYFGETPPPIHSYADLVAYLNQLNSTWTAAAKRLSPQLLIDLLAATGSQHYQQLQKLDPFETAVFAVAWAGQEQSANWFHIAREYTEKFIHQQQIREAVGKQGLFTKELFYPFIDTFMQGLPYTYRNVNAEEGCTVAVKVFTDIGGEWRLAKAATGWQLTKDKTKVPSATISLPPAMAWKLFSKGISPAQAYDRVEISGDRLLAEPSLQMVSVMA
jgi:hypothetical protein